MKYPVLAGSLAILTGIVLAALWTEANAPDRPERRLERTEMRYRTLANGTVVYEENIEEGSIEAISPAAGGYDPHEPVYRYDPLTQTYRARSVDSQGNSRQDIIRDPRNP